MKFRIEFSDAVDPVQRQIQLLRQGVQLLGRQVAMLMLNRSQFVKKQSASMP
jgi:hypothetical protein